MRLAYISSISINCYFVKKKKVLLIKKILLDPPFSIYQSIHSFMLPARLYIAL